LLRKIVIGIDGGGTTTRALASDLEGNILGYVESGSARLDNNRDAIQNVQEAVMKVVQNSQRELSDVAYLVAGIAGLDSTKDKKWVESLTDLSELHCPRLHVNDAVVAHAGALQSKSGIIAISGTGSVVYGITELNRHIRNYDMQHYANSGARHISYSVLFLILAGLYTAKDETLVKKILDHFNVSNLENLRHRLTHEGQGFIQSDWEHIGKLAPMITEAAMNDVPIAKQACDQAINELSLGIQLVGSHFNEEFVDVAFIGSVIRSKYIRLSIEERLQRASKNKSYRVQKPNFTSQAGAVLMALEELHIPLDQKIIANIKHHPKSTLV
jgi:glucosamine kinase